MLEVKVLRDNYTGEKTWEPLNNIKADDPVTVSKYVEKKGLANKPYWKWANQYLKNKKNIKECADKFSSQEKNGPIYKFGTRVPRDTKEAFT